MLLLPQTPKERSFHTSLSAQFFCGSLQLRGPSEQDRLLLEILCEQGFAIPWLVLCLQQNLGSR
jgi:hypothetical protein